VRAGAGWLLAVVLDVFSRRVVGWAMSALLETTLVLDALNMALWNRRPAPGVVTTRIVACSTRAWPTAAAVGRRGWSRPWAAPEMPTDNAIAEAFFVTLETELLDRHHFIDRGTARRALFDYIEGWYNPHRRHSALEYCSPAEFERRWEKQCKVA
jgi:putative transposase